MPPSDTMPTPPVPVLLPPVAPPLPAVPASTSMPPAPPAAPSIVEVPPHAARHNTTTPPSHVVDLPICRVRIRSSQESVHIEGIRQMPPMQGMELQQSESTMQIWPYCEQTKEPSGGDVEPSSPGVPPSAGGVEPS